MNTSFYKNRRLTLNEAFDRYLEERTDLKHASRLNYAYLYNHYVRSGLGQRKLASLSYSEFRSFYLSLALDLGLSKKTLLLIHSILNQLLKTAVRDNIIRSNPAEGIVQELSRRNGWEEAKRHALTPEQQGRFLQHAVNRPEFHSIVPLLTLLLGTGMRIGEALGLRWEDVDFSARTINVSHSLQYRKLASGTTGFYISTPKTSSGRRSIPMLFQVEEALKHMRRFQNCVSEVDGYTNFIFINNHGELYNATAVNRAIRRIIQSYNNEEIQLSQQEHRPPVLLPHFSCHHLRHTFCSRLCENETNLKIIQDIMGHASITTTMNRYAEVTEQRKAASLSQFENKILVM